MGKSAILLALASILSWTMTSSSRHQTFLEQEDEQAYYEEHVLAREKALSGFNVVVSNTSFDFTGYRTELTSSDYRDGTFDITAMSSTGDTVNVTATGRVGRADYTFVADLIWRSKLAALNIDGPVNFSKGIGSSYLINGVNTRVDDPDGHSSGVLPHAYGIYSNINQAHQEMKAGLQDELVVGGNNGGPGSFANGASYGDSHPDFDDLSDKILNNVCNPDSPHSRCIFLNGDQTFAGNDVFGSRHNPVVVVVDGNVSFRGKIKGYGVLYIKGNFKTEVGQPRWEGLIYASTQGGSHELRGQPEIYGAVILRTENPGNPDFDKSKYEPMDFTVRGEPVFHYSSEALMNIADKFDIFLPSFDPGPDEVQVINIRQASSEAVASVAPSTSPDSNIF